MNRKKCLLFIVILACILCVSCKSEELVVSAELDPKLVEQQQVDAMADKTTDEYGKTGLDYFHEATDLLDNKSYEEAIKKYEQAIKVNPKSSVFYRCKGDALLMLRRYEEAALSYDKAAELYPTSNMCYSSEALVYQLAGDFTKAFVNYSKALEITNKYPSDDNNGRLNRIYFGIGLCNLMSQEYEKAIEFMDKALELDPKMLAGYSYRAIAYMNLSKYEDGIKSCDDGLTIYPQFGLAYSTKGMIYTRMGKPDDAFKQYDKAIELKVEEPSLYYNRAITYMTINKPKECLEDLKKAVSIQPELVYQIRENELFRELNAYEEFKQLISK